MRPIGSTWKAKRPGGFDPLHATQLLEGQGRYGIPQMAPCHVVPTELVPYTEVRRLARRGDRVAEGSSVHFFLEDYRFESAWSTPERAAYYCAGLEAVLSPDFSLYRDHPIALQLHNVYRSRYLGALWQSMGMEVIPTAQWGDERSFEFCFEGMPVGGTIAVSTVGVLRNGGALDAFAAGLREMVARCKPDVLLCYGERLPDGIADIEARVYEPWQTRLRGLRKKAS
jgi:hypothetical protein